MGPCFDTVVKKFSVFIRKDNTDIPSKEEEIVVAAFEIERQWKNICFPLLTPIYTKYHEHYIEKLENLAAGIVGDNSIFEDEICKLLMKNYQIE